MADLNGYTALYEKRAGNTQTYGASDEFSCDVDIATYVSTAPDIVITTADSLSTINGILNNAAYQFIGIAAGDYASKGTFAPTLSGTAGARRVLRYYSATDDDAQPWNQSSANQALIRNIDIAASYWIIHRLTVDPNEVSVLGAAVEIDTGTASFNIVNRCLITSFRGPSGFRCRDSCQGNTLQNSVLKDPRILAGTDVNGVDIDRADHTHIVNCEIMDGVGGIGTESSTAGTNSSIYENCDIYVNEDLFSNCNASTAGFTPDNPDSACAAMENLVHWKQAADSGGSNTVKMIHCRLWNARVSDQTICCLGGSNGAAISISRDNDIASNNILLHNNIIMDCQSGIRFTSPADVDPNYDNISIVGNIFYNIKQYNSGDSSYAINSGISAKANYSEFYMNTIVASDQYWCKPVGTNCDWRGNVIIDSGGVDGSLGSGSQADYNAYYGTTTTLSESNIVNKTVSVLSGSFCTNRGCVSTANTATLNVDDIVRTSDNPEVTCTGVSDTDCYLYKVLTVGTSGTIQAVRGPYAFYRKLLTDPELVVIPYAIPHSSAPEYNFAPEQGETDAIGSRTSIGVDNTQLGSGGFMDTGIKGPRTN